MIINKNKQIIEYINRLEKNISLNYQNDFLDGYFDKKDESLVKKELYDAGQLELKDNNISLFISCEEFKKNPYMINVVNNIIDKRDLEYEEITFKKNLLFNYDSLIDDEDKELKDYMSLRTLDDDLDTIILKEKEVEWMMAVPSEAKTNDPYALKAKGRVVTFGLGIGYFIYQTLLNPNVDEIVIIEKNKNVIETFNKIKKYFPNRIPIKIINGDAFLYFNEGFLKDFDYIYVDIYQNNEDGLLTMEKMLSIYNPEVNKLDFWIESSNVGVMKTLIFLAYKEMVTNKKAKVIKKYQNLLDKTFRYFNDIDIVVSDEKILKEYMYDKKVLRDILGHK